MSGIDDIRTVGIVGAGAIGASWTALMLRYGLEVIVADPDPAAHDRLRHQVESFLAPAARPTTDPADRPTTDPAGPTATGHAGRAARPPAAERVETNTASDRVGLDTPPPSGSGGSTSGEPPSGSGGSTSGEPPSGSGGSTTEQPPAGSTSARITTCTSAAEAAAQADLVLEAGPERLEIKRAVIAEIDQAARPDVLVASSSSGLTPTSFQTAAARHPERVLVAHPFNPPHLVPLVEVVGGEHTSEEAVQRALDIFAALGRHPIRLHRELPGHVANRLQAALWQEAYHLVAEGVVSVADLDTAIASGPGLRWALTGPLLTQHLSGGGLGLRHVLQHLGPSQVAWWQTLGHPDLTPELIETLSRGVEDELAGEEESDVLARRDAALRELIETKRQLGLG